uniref:FimD/PapC C-terminal domain-containing protein n=1 Tax=Enterobacter asburiae TaxID=61645 RepID=UPI0034D369F3
MRAEYVARIGVRALVTLKLPNGKYVPFGATVKIDNDDSGEGFIVGEQGEVYITGLPEEGVLVANGGGNEGDICKASYAIKKEDVSKTLPRLSLTCN